MFWRYFIVNIHVNGLTGYFSRVCFLFFQLNLEICPIVARKNSNLSSFSIWDTTLLFQLTRYWKAQASNSNQSKLEKLKSLCIFWWLDVEMSALHESKMRIPDSKEMLQQKTKTFWCQDTNIQKYLLSSRWIEKYHRIKGKAPISPHQNKH